MAHSAVHALTPVIAKLLTCLAAVGGRRLGRAPAHTTCISVRRRALFLACFYAPIHRDPQIADLYEDEAFKLDVVHGKHPFFIYYDSDGASAPGRKACRRCVHCDGSAQLSGSLPDPGRGARGVRCVYARPPISTPLPRQGSRSSASRARKRRRMSWWRSWPRMASTRQLRARNQMSSSALGRTATHLPASARTALHSVACAPAKLRPRHPRRQAFVCQL